MKNCDTMVKITKQWFGNAYHKEWVQGENMKKWVSVGIALVILFSLVLRCTANKKANDFLHKQEIDVVEYFKSHKEDFVKIQTLGENLKPDYAIVFYYNEENEIIAYDNGVNLDIGKNTTLGQIAAVINKNEMFEVVFYSNQQVEFIIIPGEWEKGIIYKKDKTGDHGSGADLDLGDNWYYYEIAYT